MRRREREREMGTWGGTQTKYVDAAVQGFSPFRSNLLLALWHIVYIQSSANTINFKLTP